MNFAGAQHQEVARGHGRILVCRNQEIRQRSLWLKWFVTMAAYWYASLRQELSSQVTIQVTIPMLYTDNTRHNAGPPPASRRGPGGIKAWATAMTTVPFGCELRENYPYCTLCSRFADETHLATDKHLRRVEWARAGADPSAPTAPPAPPPATQPAAASSSSTPAAAQSILDDVEDGTFRVQVTVGTNQYAIPIFTEGTDTAGDLRAALAEELGLKLTELWLLPEASQPQASRSLLSDSAVLSTALVQGSRLQATMAPPPTSPAPNGPCPPPAARSVELRPATTASSSRPAPASARRRRTSSRSDSDSYSTQSRHGPGLASTHPRTLPQPSVLPQTRSSPLQGRVRVERPPTADVVRPIRVNVHIPELRTDIVVPVGPSTIRHLAVCIEARIGRSIQNVYLSLGDSRGLLGPSDLARAVLADGDCLEIDLRPVSPQPLRRRTALARPPSPSPEPADWRTPPPGRLWRLRGP